MVDGHFGGLLIDKPAHYGTGMDYIKGGRPRVTINMLPDVALLTIFDFYVHYAQIFNSYARIDTWHTLVHVCRNWRTVVFGSPRRLNLRLYCTITTPVKEMLDIWPLLPVTIRACNFSLESRMDNIFAALEHSDRISQLNLCHVITSLLNPIVAEMQQPLPALTHLSLWCVDQAYESALNVPASFLGGSAPGLQELCLYHVSFPALPNLLLSATQLVDLSLWEIRHSGYISPEAMSTCLSVLTRLETLVIQFRDPQSYPDPKSRPPQIRTLLPVLTKLWFKGASAYLDDLVAGIDAPLIDNLSIIFFRQPILDTPQFAQFISRTPKFEAHHALFSGQWKLDGWIASSLSKTLGRDFRLITSHISLPS